MTENIKAFSAMLTLLTLVSFILIATASPSERPEAFYQQTALTQ